jgi:hypothetical protein
MASLPFHEGVAPAALLLEGATRAPIIEPRAIINKTNMPASMLVVINY